MKIRFEVFGYEIARIIVECDEPDPAAVILKKVSRWWMSYLR